MKKYLVLLLLLLSFGSLTAQTYKLPNSRINKLKVNDSLLYRGNEVLTTADKPYKVYTALLTQNISSQTSGYLIIGHVYSIDSVARGDDFSNVGYVEAGVPFVAIDDTVTTWSNGTSVKDITLSAPIATVLENTLGESITWIRDSQGQFIGSCISNFNPSKTWVLYKGIESNDGGQNILYTYVTVGTQINITTLNNSFVLSDGCLYNFPIEIRVYN